jgi:hypothetical protein
MWHNASLGHNAWGGMPHQTAKDVTNVTECWGSAQDGGLLRVR